MKLDKRLKNELGALETMETVVQAYQEIAAMRMRRVKESVLSNRSFLEGLNDIYGEVSSVYNSGFFVFKTKEGVVRKTNGKTVSVLLSANTGLYGDIIRKSYDLFYDSIKHNDSDIVVVGKLGRKFYEGSDINRPFKYFDFSDSGTDEKNAKDLLEYVLSYETIAIFHGYFEDILNQLARKTLVSGGEIKGEEREVDKRVRYIFEPSIEDIMIFFENEILASIFNQSVFESSLSKFASRMISLDRAVVRLKNSLKSSNFRLRRSKHMGQNSEQLTLFSGISLWS
jgi:ATP synthase F1 gamma subunit